MRYLKSARRTLPAATMGAVALALALLAAGVAEAQHRGLGGMQANVIVLEKVALRGCPGCSPNDPKLLLPQASAAIRMDQDKDEDWLSIQVIPLKAPELSIARIKVDGVEARLDDGLWQVKRPAKTRKKPPKIEITCDDGQELFFKPQHRPFQGPVGGVIMPGSAEHPEAELSFHKKSFWADGLG